MRLQTVLLAGGVALGVLSAQAMGQNLLINGDFEADPFDTGWEGTADVVAGPGITAGSDTAAVLLPQSDFAPRTFIQKLSSSSPSDWSFEYLFATEVPSSGIRLVDFNLQFQEPAGIGTEGQINFVVSNDGTEPGTGDLRVQAFDSDSGWNNVIDSLIFHPSVDANGDNDFDDAGDTLNVYRMLVEGSFGDTPTYDVFIEHVDSGASASATDNAYFQYREPESGEGIWQVEFVTHSNMYAIDNVSLIPEPAGASLLLGGLALLARRTRRHT